MFALTMFQIPENTTFFAIHIKKNTTGNAHLSHNLANILYS